jgi:hypothetical protein
MTLNQFLKRATRILVLIIAQTSVLRGVPIRQSILANFLLDDLLAQIPQRRAKSWITGLLTLLPRLALTSGYQVSFACQ